LIEIPAMMSTIFMVIEKAIVKSNTENINKSVILFQSFSRR